MTRNLKFIEILLSKKKVKAWSFAWQTRVRGTFCWRPYLLRRATPQERRGERLTINVREAPPLEEAHAARAGRLLLAAEAAINQ